MIENNQQRKDEAVQTLERLDSIRYNNDLAGAPELAEDVINEIAEQERLEAKAFWARMHEQGHTLELVEVPN